MGKTAFTSWYQTFWTLASIGWFAAGVPGCRTAPALSSSIEVALSKTTSQSAERGVGPAGLANSQWSIVRKADPGPSSKSSALTMLTPPPPGPYGGFLSGQALKRPPVGEEIFVAQFGDEGQMTQVTNNRYLLASVYGQTIPIGTAWWNSSLPGVSYRSASYGVQDGDRVGLAVVVHVRFLQTFVGKAVLYSWGALSNDVIDGQFGYLIDFRDGALPMLGTIADQYPIEGRRVATE